MPKKYHMKHIIIGSLILVPSFSLADEMKNNMMEEPIDLGKVVVMGTQKAVSWIKKLETLPDSDYQGSRQEIARRESLRKR